MAELTSFDDGPVSVRAGSLEVRLSRSPEEIEAAQALRYRIFYEEMAAVPSADMVRGRRDFDEFDLLAIGQRTMTLADNRVEMNEQVLALLALYEAVALDAIEPLDGSGLCV